MGRQVHILAMTYNDFRVILGKYILHRFNSKAAVN